MKERGKGVESCDLDFFSSSDLPCKKHPSSSSAGICAYCLKDRLIKLVCSDCGEQRLSSCSCSDVSSYRNSSATLEVGSVGRISFLIENEKSEAEEQPQSRKPKKEGERTEEVIMLKRSNSSCVEIKKSNGFWKIGRFFRKKRGKGGFDEKSEMWVSDYTGVSRSRSLCSFRGGGNFTDMDREGSEFAFSSAKVSDVNGGLVSDSEKQCGLVEAEPRKSGFKDVSVDGASSVPTRSFLPVRESDFRGMDESRFIDLKLDYSSESKTEYSVSKMSEFPFPVSVSGFGSLRGGDHECGGSFGRLKGDGTFGKGGSCRFTVNERGINKRSKGQKVWRWIVRHNPGRRSASKKDDIFNFRP
ncbi:hypothetical protein RJ640_030934 [Escallonia rubra]|uniref:Uncharacterized protein n=1 Tax=Escallonia rubra TaxID=112253 RepID=A0AA88UC60_9ASTE|nr:hypothetical protein RJ640_030934 [Escallonia rubra]